MLRSTFMLIGPEFPSRPLRLVTEYRLNFRPGI